MGKEKTPEQKAALAARVSKRQKEKRASLSPEELAKVRKKQNERRAANKEKFREACRSWRRRNKEKVAAYNKAWNAANPGKSLAANRAWRKANKDKRLAQLRKRYREDVTYKIKLILQGQLRRVLLRKKKNCPSSVSAHKLLGCSIEAFVKHITKLFKPGMTWENHGEWHLDHILPCNIFDLSKPEDRSKCFHYTNFQPLWEKENCSKGCKVTQCTP